MPILYLLPIIAFVQVILYLITDRKKWTAAKLIILLFLLALYIFILPGMFLPHMDPEKYKCGMFIVAHYLAYWVLGGGLTIIVHLLYLFFKYTFQQNKQHMFTLQEIKDAHSKVKSGADFPSYIQDLKNLGLGSYDTFVADGHAHYYGSDNYSIISEAKYEALAIAAKSDQEQFSAYLKIHQQGQSDYLTFCQHAAGSGVEKWTVDINVMTCTYYDLTGNVMLQEQIPES